MHSSHPITDLQLTVGSLILTELFTNHIRLYITVRSDSTVLSKNMIQPVALQTNTSAADQPLEALPQGLTLTAFTSDEVLFSKIHKLRKLANQENR